MNSWSDWDKHHALCLAEWGYTRRNNARVRYYIRENNLLVMDNRAQQRELKALKEKKAMETGEIEADEDKDKMIEEADGIIEVLEEQVKKYKTKADELDAKLQEANEKNKEAENQIQALQKMLLKLQENAAQALTTKTDEDNESNQGLNSKRKHTKVFQSKEESTAFQETLQTFVRNNIHASAGHFVPTQDIIDAYEKLGVPVESSQLFLKNLSSTMQKEFPSVISAKRNQMRGYIGVELK